LGNLGNEDLDGYDETESESDDQYGGNESPLFKGDIDP